MVDCGFFYDILVRRGIDFFTGVPDSLLESFCAYVTDHADSDKHIVAANEGGAVALACGYYLATGTVGLVYMQNSGQGNSVNPLVSLADPEVYSVPMVILIGWRGEPGKHDEPQHIKQGEITLSLLDTLEMPYRVLPDNTEEAEACLEEIIDVLRRRNGPVALIVRRGTFEPYQIQQRYDLQGELVREDAIRTVVDNLDESDIVVSTTGKTSRELYEYRECVDGDHSRDFLTIGSMGHCSQIAMGIALAKPDRQVYCLDGDGAVIMHMGAVAIIGSRNVRNFRHIVFNNGCHDSVGGQPTCGFAVSITGIAKACGYTLALQAQTSAEINDKMRIIKSSDGPVMLEIRVKKGAREDLGRPKSSPQENKSKFMEFLRQ
ncbi:MAG: phosphonopyruvate decarboxylase [Planctomycetota bacterium]|jgi:phosphonopyruvate decarboxylase